MGAADFSWAPNESATVTGFAAQSATPGVEGRESAFGVTGQVGDDRWNMFATYTDIGEGFRSELGFVPRTGVRKVRVDGLWSPRIGRYGIRQIFMGPGIIRITEPDGSIQTQNVSLGPFFLFDDGSQFFFNVSQNIEGLSESFELRDGVVIEEGQYTTTDFMTMANTSESRRVSFNLFAMNNGFFDGRLRVYSPGVAVRPHPRVRLQVNYSRSEVRLPQENGHFNTNLVVLRGLVALSRTPSSAGSSSGTTTTATSPATSSYAGTTAPAATSTWSTTNANPSAWTATSPPTANSSPNSPGTGSRAREGAPASMIGDAAVGRRTARSASSWGHGLPIVPLLG